MNIYVREAFKRLDHRAVKLQGPAAQAESRKGAGCVGPSYYVDWRIKSESQRDIGSVLSVLFGLLEWIIDIITIKLKYFFNFFIPIQQKIS